jgi:hypothetical protein
VIFEKMKDGRATKAKDCTENVKEERNFGNVELDFCRVFHHRS